MVQENWKTYSTKKKTLSPSERTMEQNSRMHTLKNSVIYNEGVIQQFTVPNNQQQLTTKWPFRKIQKKKTIINSDKNHTKGSQT